MSRPPRRWLSLTRWLTALVPRRFDAELHDAERRAEEAGQALDRVAAREPAINRLVAEHERDRARNHYGERVARALREA